MRFLTYMLAALAMIAMAGCSQLQTPLDDGYQFGDAISTVSHVQTQYCANADPDARALALALLKEASAEVPDRGLCTDLKALAAERGLSVVELPDADVRAAVDDQRRAQERLEE